MIVNDTKHSTSTEKIFFLLGVVDNEVITVRYTEPREDLVRIIGAGHWRKGKKIHEKYWNENT
ncbi:MAG: hypothetical protein LBK60_00390 [Verrucomicrobiales bacterium]|nr:hypothetical protein [Verrucomicrobiales bacterium]